jgi:transcriptional regulator with XRE-family HTH domain
MDGATAGQHYCAVPKKPHPVLKLLGERIRKNRDKLDWTEERFAAEVSLSTNYISDIELGKRNISVLVLRRIARALHVTTSDLLDD